MNKVTPFDVYNQCHSQKIALLKCQKIHTSRNLISAGFTIKLKDKEKTAFIIPDGIFQYTKMPLGMTNSAATCNGMMWKLLKRVAHADSIVDDLITHTQG